MPNNHYTKDYESVTPSRQRNSWENKPEAAPVWPGPDANLPSANDRTDEPEVLALPVAPAVVPALGPVEHWSTKHGHLFSYLGLFLFTAVLYFRPYELIPALASFTSLAYWIAIATIAIFLPSQLALEGNLTARPRELRFVLLLALAAVLSIPLAIQPADAWEMFNKEFIKAVLMFIVMLNVVRTEARLKGLLLLSLAISCLLSINAVSDYSASRFALAAAGRIGGIVGGMFGNPNDMALYLVTTMPIAFALLFSTRNALMKIVYAGCVLLTMAGNVVTFSRGGFLGLMGVATVLAWKIGRRNRLLMVSFILAATLGFAVLAPGEYSNRLGSIVGRGSDVVGAASSDSRWALLLRSILITLRHPLLGVGIGNFHIVSIHEEVSHNAYTQVSAEMGLFAMMMYVLFMIAPLKRLREIERESYDTRRQTRIYYLAVGLQASIIGYMISSFFASVAYQWYIYYLVGYAIVLRRLYALQRAKQPATTSQTTPFANSTGPDRTNSFALPEPPAERVSAYE